MHCRYFCCFVILLFLCIF